MHCPKCGRQSLDQANFCRNCGANLNLISSLSRGALTVNQINIVSSLSFMGLIMGGLDVTGDLTFFFLSLGFCLLCLIMLIVSVVRLRAESKKKS